MTAAARGDENRLLAAISAEPDASYAQLARKLGWALKSGEPHKMKIKRAVDKLKQAKLITVERDKPVITEKGKKALGPSVTTDDAACEASANA